MPAYRIYQIGRDGHVLGPPQIVECADDQEAIAKAQQVVNGKDVELWEQGRFIARLPRLTHAP